MLKHKSPMNSIITFFPLKLRTFIFLLGDLELGMDYFDIVLYVLQIDVENPCVIMSQDKSREFLHSGNDRDKFKVMSNC